MDLCDYVDDIFGWEYADNLLYYEKYQKYMPACQVHLLRLWDELGIPHDEEKQVFGPSLPIIGFQVNADDMSITMPTKAQSSLEMAISHFVAGRHPNHTLWQCQRLAGYINWALNVAPCLRPGLASLYAKMSAPAETKYNANRVLQINEEIIHELHWLLNHFHHSNGIFLFTAIAWHPSKADVTIYTDASLTGIGMWSPELQTGFYADINTRTVSSKIFYYKAYVVMCAIYWATRLPTVPHRVAIFSDNSNTVDIFNSMKARDQFNELLKYAVDLIMAHNMDI